MARHTSRPNAPMVGMRIPTPPRTALRSVNTRVDAPRCRARVGRGRVRLGAVYARTPQVLSRALRSPGSSPVRDLRIARPMVGAGSRGGGSEKAEGAGSGGGL